MTIEIVEIMGRSEQGVTKLFICRGEGIQANGSGFEHGRSQS
jgi:hypothetical protein